MNIKMFDRNNLPHKLLLMVSHPLTNFEIQKYYQNEPRFNGVYSRDDWPKKNKGWDVHNKS